MRKFYFNFRFSIFITFRVTFQLFFVQKFVKEKPQNDKRVETIVQLGNRLSDQPSVPDDEREEMKEETKRTEENWRILVVKVEELQKM